MLQALSDRGLLRERNEDAAAALTLPDGSLLLAVADGLGGDSRGYLVALDGGAVQRLTEGRSWVEEQIRAGLLAVGNGLLALRGGQRLRVHDADEVAGGIAELGHRHHPGDRRDVHHRLAAERFDPVKRRPRSLE